MVAYHTPKVYRSPLGCCICKAKSSSSRFTDSARYEDDFGACFKLDEPRFGEICNACVLLIKRWKKLPVGTKRNWNHVVDARARPRGRGTTRSDISQASTSEALSTLDKLSRLKISKHRYTQKKLRSRSPTESEDHFVDDFMSEASGASVPSSRAPSPSPSPLPLYSEDDVLHARSGSSRRKQEMPSSSKYKYYRYEGFVNTRYWKKVKVCCSCVYYGDNASVIMFDPTLFKPCCTAQLHMPVIQPSGGDLGAGSFITSDGGSIYEDESLDGDNYFRRSNNEPEEDDTEESLLTQFAAALCT